MIPYEKGWSLTVDGKETELLRGDIGFQMCIRDSQYCDPSLLYAPSLSEGADRVRQKTDLWKLAALSGRRKPGRKRS